MSATSERALLRKENLQRLSTESDFFVEGYFEALKDWTFASTWLELSHAEARAITTGRARGLQGLPVAPILNALAERVDGAIGRVGGCAVVRLSTRSAKDVVLRRESTVDVFLEEDELLKASGGENAGREDVRQMIAMMRAAGRAMAARSGAEALSMFVDSQRVTDDLKEWLQRPEGEGPAMKIVVRQYVRLACELELRAFIVDRRIAAISQYYASLVVPRLIREKQAIERRVQEAFATVQGLVSLEHFVIDFAIDMEDRLWVVEINLPPPVAGMAMFDRNDPRDREIVQGKGVYEFRIREQQPEEDLRRKHQLFFDGAKHRVTAASRGPTSLPKRSLRTSG